LLVLSALDHLAFAAAFSSASLPPSKLLLRGRVIPLNRRMGARLTRRAFLARALIVGAGLAMTPLPDPLLAPVAPVAHAEHLADDLESALLELTNADRQRHGLPIVMFDPTLLLVARTRASTQLHAQALSHFDDKGQVVVRTLLAESNVPYVLAGENLARWVADSSTPERVEEVWMASQTHRKNILEPLFDRLAVGAATDLGGRVAVAQIFRAAP
jgi:uncharacterized protein YkwD